MADNKQLSRNEIMTHVSDLYKDVYGIRPRGYNFNAFTDAELNEFWNDLIEQLERNNIEEEKAEKQAATDMEALIQYHTYRGAYKRETALRWILQGYHPEFRDENEYITDYEIDGFLYSRGLSPYNDYGKGLRNELLTIARQLYKQHHEENENGQTVSV